MKRVALVALACLVASAAVAERADREKEIVIGADRWLGDDKSRVSTFEGNVVVTQGTMRMTASKVTLREESGFKYYVAQGAPVTFRQKRDKVDEWIEGFAERAEFDDRNDVLKLFNRARVKSNQNEITGDYISYDMRREVATASGLPPPGAAAAPGAAADPPRVKVIIVPAKKAASGSDEPRDPPASLKPDRELK
jgi:lipopolysaccharide export system protein LptA